MITELAGHRPISILLMLLKTCETVILSQVSGFTKRKKYIVSSNQMNVKTTVQQHFWSTSEKIW